MLITLQWVEYTFNNFFQEESSDLFPESFYIWKCVFIDFICDEKLNCKWNSLQRDSLLQIWVYITLFSSIFIMQRKNWKLCSFLFFKNNRQFLKYNFYSTSIYWMTSVSLRPSSNLVTGDMEGKKHTNISVLKGLHLFFSWMLTWF